MNITFVKKLKSDGTPCKKCLDVEKRLVKSGHINRIDRIVIADERDPESEGMKLAFQHRVDKAPFFIVEDAGETVVYTIYMRFLKEVLESTDAVPQAV